MKRKAAKLVGSSHPVEQKIQPAQPMERRAFFLPLYLPALPIESVATSHELALCIAKIKTVWEHLGAAKPHFSVLSGEQFLPENLDSSVDSFWASGRNEAAIMRQTLARHGFTTLADSTSVEYGCGVGRVTMAFSGMFASVHAYDISTNHLAIARQRADELAIDNVIFHACSEHFLDEIVPCDFFYSVIVLQHNPPPIIAELVKKALASLKAGGIAIFQVPTYIVGYRFMLDEWLNADHTLDMQMHCLPQEKIFTIISEADCKVLEVREDNWTGAPDTYISNTFVVQKRSQ